MLQSIWPEPNYKKNLTPSNIDYNYNFDLQSLSIPYSLHPTISNGLQTFKFHTKPKTVLHMEKTGFAFLNFSVSSIVLALLFMWVWVALLFLLLLFILARSLSLFWSRFCPVSPPVFLNFFAHSIFFLQFWNGIFLCLCILRIFCWCVQMLLYPNSFRIGSMWVSISILWYSTIYVICRLRV